MEKRKKMRKRKKWFCGLVFGFVEETRRQLHVSRTAIVIHSTVEKNVVEKGVNGKTITKLIIVLQSTNFT